MNTEKMEQEYKIPWLPIDGNRFDAAQNVDMPNNSDSETNTFDCGSLDSGLTGDAAGVVNGGGSESACASSGSQTCSTGIGM